MDIYVVSAYRHESWPSYAATTLDGALAWIKAWGYGEWAIARWRLDTPHGIPPSLGMVYDAETMEFVDE